MGLMIPLIMAMPALLGIAAHPVFAAETSLTGIGNKTFATRNFRLENGELGHLASGADAAKWIPALRNFLGGLPRPGR